MCKTVQKFRAQSSTTEGIVEECKKETQCGECDVEWLTPPKGIHLSPPEHTVAVVVDVTSSQGAIRLFDKETGHYIDGVGIEDKGFRVIVPWKNAWRFRASGTVVVGYVKAKDVA